jgi:hypothetical protein
MRPIQDYGLRDWLVLDPIRHRFRRLRNLATIAAYKARRASDHEEILARLRKSVEGKTAAFAVAFHDERSIASLADAFSIYLPDTALVVCDNSLSSEARQRIEAVCLARGAFYVPLPPPPMLALIRTNPSLSHGTALTWIFYNLVRPLKPDVFALFDHDLIPIAPIDLRELVKTQPIYGEKRDKSRHSPWHWWDGRPAAGPWNLWAGYCVYNFAAVADRPLDFTPDHPIGLDTGGQNWTRFYRYLDPAPMRFTTGKYIEIKSPTTGMPARFRIIDDALFHIGGISHRSDAKERVDLTEYVFEKLLVERQPLDAFIATEATIEATGMRDPATLRRKRRRWGAG